MAVDHHRVVLHLDLLHLDVILHRVDVLRQKRNDRRVFYVLGGVYLAGFDVASLRSRLDPRVDVAAVLLGLLLAGQPTYLQVRRGLYQGR